MKRIHIIALVCQVCLVIFMIEKGFRIHDNYLFLGALGWFVAACYNVVIWVHFYELNERMSLEE